MSETYDDLNRTTEVWWRNVPTTGSSSSIYSADAVLTNTMRYEQMAAEYERQVQIYLQYLNGVGVGVVGAETVEVGEDAINDIEVK